MRATLISVLFLSVQLLQAQDSCHTVAAIPQELKTDAYAIIRLDETQIDLENPYKMTVTKHRIVTVLNKYGNDYAELNVDYDKHSSIKTIKIYVYDALGNEIKKVKSSDINDYSASGGSLYTDDRVKNYEYIPISYPYTIDYITIVESENTAFYPRWYPVLGYNASTEQSHFTVNYPADQLIIKVTEKYFNGYQFNNTSSNGHIEYSAHNIKAIEEEPYSPAFSNFAPHLLLAANKFNLQGVHGAVNNWEELGAWINSNLLSGINQISEQTKNEVKNLVNGIDDPVERARKVYYYMQNKTHYISVQIGIGGWQPMPAAEVDHLKYGDCKALVNYTQTLLKTADVDTYYTIINANENLDIDKDQVSFQGNHAILTLPTKKDTIYLECTSQKEPFGYMGKFTNDREAFMVKPNGGQFIHTKAYAAKESYQNTVGSYQIDDNGFLKGSLTIESAGTQFENHFHISDESHEDVVKFYKSYFGNINNLSVLDFENKTDTLNNKFIETIKLNADSYGRNSGNRILLTLNAFNRSTDVPKRMTNRLLPVEIENGFIDRDSVTISLPISYKIEALPATVQIDSEFGNYHAEVIKQNDSTLIYKRSYLLKQGLYPKEAYEAFRKFIKEIVLKDNNKTILIKTIQ